MTTNVIIKRILFIILLLLFALPISAHAAPPENGQLYLVTHLTNIINFLSSALCLIAACIVLYGVFGYVQIHETEEAMERSKWQMLYGGIGLFISIAIKGLSKLINYMTGNTPPAPSGFSSLLLWVSLLLLVLLIGYFCYQRVRRNQIHLEAEKADQELSNIYIPSEDLHTYLSLLSKGSYLFQVGLTEIRGEMEEWSAKYLIRSSTISLHIYHKERHIISSTTIRTSTIPQHQLAEGVSLEGEAIPLSALFASIHQSFLAQYLHQHHHIKEWAKVKTSLISSYAIFHSVLTTGKKHQKLLFYASQCTAEQNHFLENAFFRDLDQMLQAYKNLSESQQQKHESGLLQRIETLSEQLDSIQETIDVQKEQDIAYAFRIIDEKYAQN